MKRRDFLQTTGLAALGTTPAIAGKTASRPAEQIRWKSEYAYLKTREPGSEYSCF